MKNIAAMYICAGVSKKKGSRKRKSSDAMKFTQASVERKAKTTSKQISQSSDEEASTNDKDVPLVVHLPNSVENCEPAG